MPEPSKTQRQPLSFTATDWKDDKAGGTPITAAQLNRVEKGIADAVKGVNDANKRVLTFLVQSDGEHATQDINGAAITAPCQIYSIDEKKTWVDDGVGARIAPFTTAEEMKSVRDSLSHTVSKTDSTKEASVGLGDSFNLMHIRAYSAIGEHEAGYGIIVTPGELRIWDYAKRGAIGVIPYQH